MTVMTEEQIEFAIFCIESVSERTGQPGEKIFDLLTKQSDILYSYIIPSYDVLHTQGKAYIIDDILGVMEQKRFELDPVSPYQKSQNNMTAHPILLQKKYARVVKLFAEEQGIPLERALDFFYHSFTYQMMRQGVSDLPCMSDGYLSDELKQEWAKQAVRALYAQGEAAQKNGTATMTLDEINDEIAASRMERKGFHREQDCQS